MTVETAPATSLGLRQYARVLARHWVLVLVGVLLGLIAGAGSLLLAQPQVTATTQLSLRVISTDPFNPQRQSARVLSSDAEASIAKSVTVARRAAAALPGTTPGQVRSASTVTVDADGAFADISYAAATKAEAVRGADAVGRAYLAQRTTEAEGQVSQLLAKVNPQINRLTNELTRANGTIATAEPTSTDYARANGVRDRTRTELGGLYNSRNSLLTLDTRAGSVLVPAADNQISYGPSGSTRLLAGLAGGLVLGVLLAFARNRLVRTLRSRTEVEDVLDRPLLGTLTPAAMRLPLADADADALSAARERILDQIDPSGATLTVLDATGDDHSQIGAGLGRVIADTGTRVRLVLTAALPPEAAAAVTNGPFLQLSTPSSGVGIDSTVRTALRRPTSDLLIVAGASTGDTQATQLELLRHANAVVLVLRAGQSHRKQVVWLREQAALMGADLVGAILVRGSDRAQPATADAAAAPEASEPEAAPAKPEASRNAH